MKDVPIYEKYGLTVSEAAAYFGIGEVKIREMIKEPACDYVMYVGKKAVIKRVQMAKYLDKVKFL